MIVLVYIFSFYLLFLTVRVIGQKLWDIDDDAEPFWTFFSVFCSFIIVFISFLIYFVIRNNSCI